MMKAHKGRRFWVGARIPPRPMLWFLCPVDGRVFARKEPRTLREWPRVCSQHCSNRVTAEKRRLAAAERKGAGSERVRESGRRRVSASDAMATV
jgi:hypothetical protein